MIGFLFRVFGLFVRFVCMAFLVSGVGIMFGFVPFRTCPLFALMFVSPLSVFRCLVCSPTLSFSLSLSLSQALGKPKPRWGFGFPLVFSAGWTRTTSSIRTTCSAYSSRHCSRDCLFFSFASPPFVVCWLVLWRSVAFLFGFFLGLWWWMIVLGRSGHFLHCMQDVLGILGRGRRTRHPSPFVGLLL